MAFEQLDKLLASLLRDDIYEVRIDVNDHKACYQSLEEEESGTVGKRFASYWASEKERTIGHLTNTCYEVLLDSPKKCIRYRAATFMDLLVLLSSKGHFGDVISEETFLKLTTEMALWDAFLVTIWKGEYTTAHFELRDKVPTYVGETLHEDSDSHLENKDIFLSDEHYDKALAQSRYVEFMWYPHTPIGSHSVVSNDFGSLYDYIHGQYASGALHH